MEQDIKTLDGLRAETLSLEWVAVYNDGSELWQHYGKPDEKHFGHIDLDKLTHLLLVDEDGNKEFGIDVDKQAIMIGGYPFVVEFPRDCDGKVVKGKIVYFRRNRVDVGPEGQVITVRYALGFQANIMLQGKHGRYEKNFQQYLFINNDGTFTLSQQK